MADRPVTPEQTIQRLAKLRADVLFVRSFIEHDPDQSGGFLDEFSEALPALLAVAEAANELLGNAAVFEEGTHTIVALSDALARLTEQAS